MNEIITITTDTGTHRLPIAMERDQQYAIIEEYADGSIQQIVWEQLRSESSEHLFFWLARKLIAKMCFNGNVIFKGMENRCLSDLFFFPADRLGAIVSPIENDNDGYGVRLGGVHQRGIAARAGMQIGDVLLRWNDQEISEHHRPWKYCKGKETQRLSLRFSRDGILHDTEVSCALPLTNAEILDRIADLFGLIKEEDYIFSKYRPVLSEQPLVSVLIHAYKPTWFAEALESVLNQHYPNIEIIIGDDNTKGEIKAIVDSLAPNDPRIRYFLNDPPFQGWGAGNRYFCFSQAKGELIKYLCDDDFLQPNCLEKMVAILQRHPQVAIVTSHRNSVDEQSKRIRPHRGARRIAHCNSIIDGLRATNIFHGFVGNAVGEPSTTMFRKEQVINNPFYLDTLAGVEAETGMDDANLWCSLLLRGKLFYFAESLSSFRVTSQQGSSDYLLQQDVYGKWVRQTDLLYRIGALDFPKEFRMKPEIYPVEEEQHSIEEMSPLNLERMLRNLEHPLPSEGAKKVMKQLRKYPAWPILQLLFGYKMKGRYLPTSVQKCQTLTAKLQTNLFFSYICPIIFHSRMFNQSYCMYFPSLRFPSLMLCKIQCADGNTSHQISYMHNHLEWKKAQHVGELFLLELEEHPIDHLLQFTAQMDNGNDIGVVSVELVALLPFDVV